MLAEQQLTPTRVVTPPLHIAVGVHGAPGRV